MDQRFAGATQAGSAASALPTFSLLGIASSQKSKVLMVINSPGWHCLADPCPALSSPIFTLLWKCNISAHCYGRSSIELLIRTSWEEIFLQTSASVQTANHWMQQLLGPGFRLPTGTWPRASASSSAPWMVSHLAWGADGPPASIPPGAGVGDTYPAPVYPNAPPPPPASDILKNAITRLGLFLARLHPCAQSSHTYLFHRIARKVSKPLASPSEFPSQSSEAEASSVGELADMARCLRSGGEMQASIPAAGRGALPPPSRVKKPSWSPLPGGEAAPCHPFNFVRVFPGEENEIPALELAPPCQNGSDLCNHTRFSGYFISAVMRLCKPLKAKCFLLL